MRSFSRARDIRRCYVGYGSGVFDAQGVRAGLNRSPTSAMAEDQGNARGGEDFKRCSKIKLYAERSRGLDPRFDPDPEHVSRTAKDPKFNGKQRLSNSKSARNPKITLAPADAK